MALSPDFVIAGGALIIASVSPIGVSWYNRRQKQLDKKEAKAEREIDEKRRSDEEAHRQEVAAKALEIAQKLMQQSQQLNQATRENFTKLTTAMTSTRLAGNGVLTATLERELDAIHHCIRAMQAGVSVKQEANVPIIEETYTILSLMQSAEERLDSEIKYRKKIELGLEVPMLPPSGVPIPPEARHRQ